VARSILGPHAKSWQVETSRMRVFSGIFDTKMPRRPAKIADFGIVLPSGVKEWLSRVSSRTAHRVGFPLTRIWWRPTRPRREGVAVAVCVGSELLLVRPSYRFGWHLDGGSLRRGETPETAACA
jgi:hypothetical protein